MENIYRLPYPVNYFNEHYNPSANMPHKQGLLVINAFQKRLVLVSSYVIIAQNRSKVAKILRNAVGDKPAHGLLLVERDFRGGNLKDAK